MPVPFAHLRHQGPMLRALGRTFTEVARQHLGHPSAPRPIPGPPIRAVLPARDALLVRDFVRAMGGDPSRYAGVLPPLLFPQWVFPLLAETLVGLPYPLERVLNAGCHLKVSGPLPSDAPLHVEARLAAAHDDGQRVLLHQTVQTGPPDCPDALRIDFHPLIPLGRPSRGAAAGKPKARPQVPADARLLERWALRPRDAVDFALLTGDFNPIHWLPPAARASGFKSTILHGFATLGRAVEGVTRALWGGDPSRLGEVDVRFTRPLALPARVGLYLDEEAGALYVGEGPGAEAYLTGRIRPRPAP